MGRAWRRGDSANGDGLQIAALQERAEAIAPQGEQAMNGTRGWALTALVGVRFNPVMSTWIWARGGMGNMTFSV